MFDTLAASCTAAQALVGHRLPLTAAPEAYDKFDRRVEGYTKVVLRPQTAA